MQDFITQQQLPIYEELFKNLNYCYPYVERYYDASTETQEEFPYDKYWNGLDLYTNVFYEINNFLFL